MVSTGHRVFTLEFDTVFRHTSGGSVVFNIPPVMKWR